MENIVNTSKQLGQALRQLRKSKGKTQDEVSKTVGLLQKTVSALETSPERSEVGSLLKLISALELDLILRPKRDRNPDAW